MKNPQKKTILVLIDWYEPGFKAGGPIRSVVNFVFHLKSDFNIFLLTSDRDLGEDIPYQGVVQDQWISADGYKIFYASPAFLKWKNILSLVTGVNPGFIYLNSMFSKAFSVYPVLMKRLNKTNAGIVLAPRGMLRSSALDQKSFKKKIFLFLFRFLGLERNVLFHATDDIEVKDIDINFPKSLGIKKIANLPGVLQPFFPAPIKIKGRLRMIFVGRIHPIKNLNFLLEILHDIQEPVELTIVAATDDADYWEKIKKQILLLPSNISITLFENLPHSELATILKDHHVFVLPTKGENFGHAIYEALSSGRPAIISDQTPWRNLKEHKAGYDISLLQMDEFKLAIHNFINMDQDEMDEWCACSREYCVEKMNIKEIKNSYVDLFS